jgi:predicted AAA+ superfamily ATPase
LKKGAWGILSFVNRTLCITRLLSEAADISTPTLKKYLGILEKTYMVRLLLPFETNLKKRLVKSPKVYLRDSGILHGLLGIETYNDLLAHPKNGASFEGFALENLAAAMPRHRPSFIRTSNGAEVDLVMENEDHLEVFEIKLSKSPKPSRGFHDIVAALKPAAAWVVAPVEDAYPIADGITVAPLERIYRREE